MLRAVLTLWRCGHRWSENKVTVRCQALGRVGTSQSHAAMKQLCLLTKRGNGRLLVGTDFLPAAGGMIGGVLHDMENESSKQPWVEKAHQQITRYRYSRVWGIRVSPTPGFAFWLVKGVIEGVL